MTISIIFLIAAGVVTAANIACLIIADRRRRNLIEWYDAIENVSKLKEYQKRRMCSSYCKFRESAKTQEELDWKCADCPINEL